MGEQRGAHAWVLYADVMVKVGHDSLCQVKAKVPCVT